MNNFNQKKMSKSEILTETNEEAVISRLWSTIEKLAGEAIERDGVFRIGLSGGSLIKYLAAGAEKCNTDWTKWQLFFCDERYVPEDDEDSTFGQYKKHFLTKTKLTEAQFAVANVQLALKECAVDYEQQIYTRFGFPEVFNIYCALFLINKSIFVIQFLFFFSCAYR